jgi:cholesterol oxidase
MTGGDVDVVVIGSGFGGSVTANRLALAGKRVLVLERGPWRDSVPVRSMGITRRSPFPYGMKALTHLAHSVHRGRLDLRLNKAGMYEVFVFPGLYALAASAVGGGSTAYGGILQAPRNTSIWHGRHPELDPAGIERYYDKVIADMGGVRLSREHPLPQSVWTHFPDSADRRCRPAEPQPHVGFLLPTTLAQAGTTTACGPARLERQYCAFDGDSFLGSRGGAKASVDFVYLAPVLDQGVTVRDFCEVDSIKPSRPVDGAGYIVQFKDLASGTREQVHAAQVVLAAGTLNTLRLLFNNSGQPGGLGPMPSLGRSVCANSDLMAVWVRPSAPVSSFCSVPPQGEFTVAGHAAPAYGLGGFPGLDTLPLPAFVKRRLAQVFLMYGMGADSGKASVTCDGGHLHSDYDHRQEPIYDDIRGAFRIVASESGDKVLTVPKPITAHTLGGACVGADAEHGVVDHLGEVYGNPGLYVADASALPAAPGGPPAVVIAAWAHHVADGISRSSWRGMSERPLGQGRPSTSTVET